MTINHIQNSEGGLSVRTKLNSVIDGINYIPTMSGHLQDQIDNFTPGGGASSTDNIVQIDTQGIEDEGDVYTSISGALIYVLTQFPVEDNRWGLKFSGENNENFEVPDYVDIIGEFGSVLNGIITSSGTEGRIYNCRIDNLQNITGTLSFYNCTIPVISGTKYLTNGTYNLYGGYLTGSGTLDIGNIDPITSEARYYYSMEDVVEDVNGVTSINDATVSNYNLTWLDASPMLPNSWGQVVADGGGSAVYFAASGGYVYATNSIPTSIDPEDTFSLLFKLKFESLPTAGGGDGYLWEYQNFLSGGPAFKIWIDVTESIPYIHCGMVDDSTNQTTLNYDISGFSTDNYYWLGFIINRSTDNIEFYIDGTVSGTQDISSIGTITPNQEGGLAIEGIVLAGITYGLTISEIYFCDKALTGDELIGIGINTSGVSGLESTLNLNNVVKDTSFYINNSGGTINNKGSFYNNSSSGLVADDFQGAVDELNTDILQLSATVSGQSAGTNVFTASGTISENDIVSYIGDGYVEKTRCLTELVTTTSGGFNPGVSVITSDQQSIYTFSIDGTVAKGAISNGVITYGSPIVVCSGTLTKEQMSIVIDQSQYIVILSYVDLNNSNYGTSVTCYDVSGLTIGTPVVFTSNSIYELSSTWDSTNNRVIVSYNHDNTVYINIGQYTAIDTLEFGTEQLVASSISEYYPNVFYASYENKIIVSYTYDSDLISRVGTLLDGVVNFGDPVTIAPYGNRPVITYDSYQHMVVFSFSGRYAWLRVVASKLDGNSIIPLVIGDYGQGVAWNHNGNSFSAVYNPTTKCHYLIYGYDTVPKTRLVTFSVGNDGYIATKIYSLAMPAVNYISLSTNDKVENSDILIYDSSWEYGQDSTYDKIFTFWWSDDEVPFENVSYINTNTNVDNYIGIASESVTSGQDINVVVNGGIKENFYPTWYPGSPWMVTGANYYLPAVGEIYTLNSNTSLPSVSDMFLGVALDSKTFSVNVRDNSLSKALNISFNPGKSGLTAVNAQDAIDNLKTYVDNLHYTGKLKRTTTSGTYDPSALTDDYLIAITTTVSGMDVIISTEDVQSGTTVYPRVMIIKDESGNVSGNDVNIQLETGNIDGQASIPFSTNYGCTSLYIDGTNGWTFVG